MTFDRTSNSFSVGSYYLIECTRDTFYIGFRLIGGELREGRITSEQALWYETAMCVKRTERTVTFRIPLLGKDVRVWTKRMGLEIADNEIARIPQQDSENGLIPGRTTYPQLMIVAYDSNGNNAHLNSGDWKATLDELYGKEVA